MRWAGLVVTLFLAVGCNSSATEQDIVREAPMDRETFKAMLYETINIEGARKGQRMMGDSSYSTQFFNTLMEDYQVEDSLFDAAFLYYHRHPEFMEVLYGEILDSLKQDLLELNQKG